MINFIYLILLMISAAAVTYSIPGYAIFLFSLFFFVLSYRKFKVKSGCKTTAIIQMICYSIPLSFRNIMGGEYGELPIAWFYLLGALLAVHLLSKRKPIRLSPTLAFIAMAIVMVMMFTFVPLMLTNTNYFSQGVSQFVILMFHNGLLLIALLKNNVLTADNSDTIEKSYISAGLITSVGIVLQFAFYKYGIILGVIEYFNNRLSFNFLFSDASHLTLYLATTAFLSILLANRNENSGFKYNLIAIITLAGSAVTSARTGLVVFFAVYAIYMLVGQKGITKKLTSIVVGSIALYGAYSFFTIVRQQDIQEILLNSSGRTVGYKVAFDMFLENPFLGYGFGKDYIAGLMRQSIPHLSFLQYLVHAGIFYTVMIFGIIFYTFVHAAKGKLNESWLILMTVLGTCLVPDIFSTRYITLLMVLVFLRANTMPTPSPSKLLM